MSWLPNLVTCVRIVLTPVVSSAVLSGRCGVALPLALVAGATDAVDGYLARRFGAASRLGAWLDPIADKLLLVSLYLSFGFAAIVPPWLVWMVVGRDVLILAMSAAGVAFAGIRDFPPTIWGKISTVVQIVGSVVLLAVCSMGSLAAIVPVVVWAVAVATAWSGVHYTWRGITLFRRFRRNV